MFNFSLDDGVKAKHLKYFSKLMKYNNDLIQYLKVKFNTGWSSELGDFKITLKNQQVFFHHSF